MTDERSILAQIRISLGTLQEQLGIAKKQAERYDPLTCKRDTYFTGAIVESRTALRTLQARLDSLVSLRPTADTKFALAQTQLLATDVERFSNEPANLKLPSALAHLNQLIDIMPRIDPTFQPLKTTTQTLKTLSPDERKKMFLQLWTSERGYARMQSILQNLILLKQLLAQNTQLRLLRTLSTSTQARTRTGETQAEVEAALLAQTKDLQDKLFKPCLVEGDITAFYTRSPWKPSRLVRSCPVRKIFLDEQPLTDPVALIASDWLCAFAYDLLDLRGDPELERTLNVRISAPLLVRIFMNIKDSMKDLAQIIPERESGTLKQLIIAWVDTHAIEWAEIGRQYIALYPHLFGHTTRDSLLTGL